MNCSICEDKGYYFHESFKEGKFTKIECSCQKKGGDAVMYPITTETLTSPETASAEVGAQFPIAQRFIELKTENAALRAELEAMTKRQLVTHQGLGLAIEERDKAKTELEEDRGIEYFNLMEDYRKAKAELAKAKEDSELLSQAILTPNTFLKICHENCGGLEDEEIVRTKSALREKFFSAIAESKKGK